MITDFLAGFYDKIIVAEFAILFCMGIATLCLKIPDKGEFARYKKSYRYFAWSMIAWSIYGVILYVTEWRVLNGVYCQALTISCCYIKFKLLALSVVALLGRPQTSTLTSIFSFWVALSLSLFVTATSLSAEWTSWIMNIMLMVVIADVAYSTYKNYCQIKDARVATKWARYIVPIFLIWFFVGLVSHLMPLGYVVLYIMCGLCVSVWLFLSYTRFLIGSVVEASGCAVDLTSVGYECGDETLGSTTLLDTPTNIIPELRAIKRGVYSVSKSFNARGEITTKAIEHLEIPVDRWVEQKGFLKADLTIETMAADIGTNRAYLSAHINSRYNMNFRNWIALIRLEYSRELLSKNSDLSIVDAAEMVQYSQSSYSTIFKKHYGISPSEWRYRQREVKRNS